MSLRIVDEIRHTFLVGLRRFPEYNPPRPRLSAGDSAAPIRFCMSRPITSLRFPGEKAWELWRCNRAGQWEMSSITTDAEKIAMQGVQTVCVDSSPFWQLTQDAGGGADVEDVALLRWEAAGMTEEEGSRQSALWEVMHQPHRALMASMAVSPEMMEDTSLALPAEDYEISARLLPLPTDGLAIWTEMGRHAAAFTRDGALMHVMLLAAPALDDEALVEIRDAMRALDAQEFLGRLTQIRVWTECEDAFLSGLSRVLGSDDVVREPRPAPQAPTKTASLVPLEVARQRAERRRRMRLMQIGSALLAVFVVVFSAWAALLFLREKKLNEAEARMLAHAPDVAVVHEARDAWLALEPAVNPDLYPTEVYHQVLSIIPERGLRLNLFKLEAVTISIEGEASDNPTYFDFRDKLMSSPALSRYEWSDKPPTPLDGSRVNFKADGILKAGGLDEAQ